MAGHGSKSWEIREVIAEKLATGESVEHAVCGTKCTPRTVYRWLADDLDFQLLVEEIRAELLQETRGLRVAAAKRASRRLMRLLASEDEKTALKAVGIALQGLGELQAVTADRKAAIERQIGQLQATAENIALAEQLAGRNGAAEDGAPNH
jgi:hypothetical protein